MRLEIQATQLLYGRPKILTKVFPTPVWIHICVYDTHFLLVIWNLGMTEQSSILYIQFSSVVSLCHPMDTRFWQAFLMAQLVKNLPAMWETWVQSLVWEDPLENRNATHSSILVWRIPRIV